MSATLTVQEISYHHQDTDEINKYMGKGEPSAFKYMRRPKSKPSESVRNAQLGFLTDLYKLLTRVRRPRRREEGDLSPEGLVQVIRDMDSISQEMK